MFPSARNQVLALIALLGIGVADLAWLTLSLAPQLAAQVAATETIAVESPSAAKGGEPAAASTVSAPARSQLGRDRASGPPVHKAVQPAVRPPEPAVQQLEPQSGARPQVAAPEAAAAQPSLAALPDIYFETGRARLSGLVRTQLSQVAALMRKNRQARLLVRGHADERGSESYNKALSASRARTVVRYLSGLGVRGGRVEIVAVGSSKPVDTRGTSEAWAKNRRVQLVWQMN